MPRAIDFHVHLPTADFLEVAIGPYKEAADRFFRTEVQLRDVEEMAAYYQERDLVGVLLAWDAETATGRQPLKNDTVAEIVRRYPGTFVGFASVDPHKGKQAIAEAERAIRDLGLSGLKFHAGFQQFYPHDRQFYPLWEKIAELGVPALFHTGTTGLGAGLAGGGGVKLDYTRPIWLDHVAADFPELIIVGAHPSWPWHEEMLAIVQHKANVYNDLSGWSPKYIPASLLREAAGRTSHKFLFGSDYPFITPDRWFKDFAGLEAWSEEKKQQLFFGNAQRVLGKVAAKWQYSGPPV
jgi:predicted TIM-barrel fold metal-dependent hydrolase